MGWIIRCLLFVSTIFLIYSEIVTDIIGVVLLAIVISIQFKISKNKGRNNNSNLQEYSSIQEGETSAN
jgi:UPF0716 family protein affecting phage T7 exclusion